MGRKSRGKKQRRLEPEQASKSANGSSREKIVRYFGFGTTLLLVLLESLGVTYKITAFIAAAVAICYAAGLYSWTKQFQPPAQHMKASRLLSISVPGLFLLSCGLAFFLYHDVFPTYTSDELHELEQLRDRYRYVLGLTPKPPNVTTLIELTNVELKQKAVPVYQGIDAMNAFYDENVRRLDNQLQIGEISQAEFNGPYGEEMAKARAEYDQDFRVDAAMVTRELKNRIPEEDRNHLPSVLELNPADRRERGIGISNMMASFAAFPVSNEIARQIEELVKLLPD